MKTLKTLLSIFALAAVFSAGAYAQNANADVNVNAEVQADLTLTPTAVDLGTVEPVAVVLAANTNDGTSSNTSGTAGALQIQGTAGIDVSVSYTSATLSNGASTVAFTPSVYNGGTHVVSNDNVTIAGGDVTLDIGGSADFSSASAGTYVTDTHPGASPITFTIEYQ